MAASTTDYVALNNVGQLVGFYDGQRPFKYSGGVFTNLPTPVGSISTTPYGVNDFGVIVGIYSSSSAIHGFEYSGGTYTDVQFIARDINNAGVIVGTPLFSTGAVPEASTWAMLLIGFAGIGFAACRRGRRIYGVPQ
jgi:hypothetical protein